MHITYPIRKVLSLKLKFSDIFLYTVTTLLVLTHILLNMLALFIQKLIEINLGFLSKPEYQNIQDDETN